MNINSWVLTLIKLLNIKIANFEYKILTTP